MKIIILYAAAGSGHKRAAEALHGAFMGLGEKNVSLKEVLDFTNPRFKKQYIGGYEFLVKFMPTLWAFSFYICDLSLFKPIIALIRRIVNSTNSKPLEEYLEKEKFDAVVTTHFLPVEVVSRMRAQGKGKFKFICVVTDFNVHSFWVSNLVDEYIVANDHTKNILIDKFKIDVNKIRVLGIPIDAHFSLPKDRAILAKQFNSDPSKFTVLIIAGTFGIGPLEKIAKELAKDNQVIVGCGKNKKLLEDLTDFSKHEPNLRPVGFVNYVDELMALSDVIITKPGGLTISESLAMSLPMIFIAAIKGQETNNANLMVNSGVGFNITNLGEIPALIRRLSDNPSQVRAIKQKISFIARPDSARQIAKHILGLNA